MRTPRVGQLMQFAVSKATGASGGTLRVVVVYGTRPEAIKMAPVIRQLRQRPERFEVVVCATGQHREMVEPIAELFGLRPDLDLGLMRPGQSLNELTSRALSALGPVLRKIAPDWVLVQGDTTTAMSAALAAFHLRLPVGHVEAGLRTGDLARPFPEEANRGIIDLVAEAMFAPTATAARQLRAAGRDSAKIFLTGNTGMDSLHWVAATLPDEAVAAEVLITVHRRESFGAPLSGILGAVRELAVRFPDIRFVFPVHPNPRVAEPAVAMLSTLPNVLLTAPLAYDQMVRQIRRALVVLTDSGGLQEEAPAFGRPVLVLRDTTERPEGVEAGLARLVGTDTRHIVAETARLLTDPEAYGQMSCLASPYGDGHAAERIVAVLAGEPFAPFAPTPDPSLRWAS